MTQIYGNLNELMDRCKVEERVQGYIRRCVEFHTFPAAGLLIGVFMADLALEKLGAKPGQKLYAVSETPKCAPDAVQVITGATIGNHRLRIIDTGRYAITVNRLPKEGQADGIRVYVDAKKMIRYPTLHLWYTNDPGYKGGKTSGTLLEEILVAGRDILSWERVKVELAGKEKWNSATCPKCGEMVPENTLVNGICRGCGSLAYYRRTD